MARKRKYSPRDMLTIKADDTLATAVFDHRQTVAAQEKHRDRALLSDPVLLMQHCETG